MGRGVVEGDGERGIVEGEKEEDGEGGEEGKGERRRRKERKEKGREREEEEKGERKGGWRSTQHESNHHTICSVNLPPSGVVKLVTTVGPCPPPVMAVTMTTY